MKKLTVTRDGERDLRFMGEELAEVNNKWVAGKDQSRWTELTLFKVVSGKYVLYEVARTLWQGELDRHCAAIYDTAEDILNALMGEAGGMSDLDKELLQAAAKTDVAFKDLWTEELE